MSNAQAETVSVSVSMGEVRARYGWGTSTVGVGVAQAEDGGMEDYYGGGRRKVGVKQYYTLALRPPQGPRWPGARWVGGYTGAGRGPPGQEFKRTECTVRCLDPSLSLPGCRLPARVSVVFSLILCFTAPGDVVSSRLASCFTMR